MILRDILRVLNANHIYIDDQTILDRDFICVSVTDLMSDALAMVCSAGEHTFLLTGLVNAQSIRTAEMLDINTIIYVRDKVPQQDDLNVGIELKMNLFTTSLSMYEASGLLYESGLKTATR
ncbi:MAG: hypothetical protein PHP11_02025 [Erysipelotrichaceae bacterium]|nr:hypothetical protein [Erysipelotrichaceae bacterium]MDD3923864.1 hypothetical protein [Erysipelotrichaceae bacterium]MDD4641916.1 hypothetical protein [Erysipelotrichaceae bacterium]